MQRYFFTRWLQRVETIAGGGVCLKGTGILASVVAGRFAAGESLDELAKDYRVPRQAIDAAVRLVLHVHGTALWSKRALAKLDLVVPLQRRRIG